MVGCWCEASGCAQLGRVYIELATSAQLTEAEGAELRLQIVKYLRDATHELRYTTMVALLQPAPETYELFDDVLLLSDGAQRAARCLAACLAAGCWRRIRPLPPTISLCVFDGLHHEHEAHVLC